MPSGSVYPMPNHDCEEELVGNLVNADRRREVFVDKDGRY